VNQTLKKQQVLAGISFAAGKKDQYYISILHYYASEDRWFLKTLSKAGEFSPDKDENPILQSIEQNSINSVVVDFPLTAPLCQTCPFPCPGVKNCIHPDYLNIALDIKKILSEDLQEIKTKPKQYEQKRRLALINKSSEENNSELKNIIISKSFKRKLKSGFVPYWHRPVDYFIWKNYYDFYLKYFDLGPDFFGNFSIKLFHQFNYIQKKLEKSVTFYESNVGMILIELMRAQIIREKNIKDLKFADSQISARKSILKSCEEKLGLFIYEADADLISKKNKAFESFILSLSLWSHLTPLKNKKEKNNANLLPFVCPDFSSLRAYSNH
jgi:hypothetical protein